MSKKYEEFGGWLKFFYFLCLLNIVSSITMIIILGSELFESQGRPFFEIIIEGLQVAITLYLLYLIIKVIQFREPAVPEYIKDKLYLIFIVALLYFVVHTILTLPGAEWQMKNTVALAGSIQSMLWAAIWRTYYEKSERVQVYYKLDQDQEDTEDEMANQT